MDKVAFDMVRRLLFCGIGLLVVLGTAKAAPAEAEPDTSSSKNSMLPSEEGAWVVELDTRDGFTGNGRGGVTITSHGLVFARQIGLISSPLSPCRTELSPTEFEPIKQAVLKAKPSAWEPRYVPSGDNGCCDRFHWTFKLHRREADGTERTYTTFWYDANERRLPNDLAAVREATVTILDAVLKTCKQ